MRLLILVIGMTLVTYIPRMLPLVGLRHLNLSPRLARFLQYVPIAALGSLTFPAIIYSTGNIKSALAGSVAAAALAIMRFNIMVVVLGAIIMVLMWDYLGTSLLVTIGL
jgi:branched-subunit amino acid transport protein